jgi:import inner membrane translocase subunit TIM10
MWSGSYAQQYVNPQNLEAAEQEIEMFMDLYNRYANHSFAIAMKTTCHCHSYPSLFVHSILGNCRNKCIPRKYHEPDLSKGEMVCIDRCVAKYISIQKMLGKKMEQNAEGLSNLGSSGGGIPSTLDS